MNISQPDTMSDMTQNTVEEAEDRYERVIISSITSVGYLSKLLTVEENIRVHQGEFINSAERSSGYTDVFNEKFWNSIVSHKNVLIRRAAYNVLSVMCIQIPASIYSPEQKNVLSLQKLSNIFCQFFNEKNQQNVSSVFLSFLSFIKSFPSSLSYIDIELQLVPKLLLLLEINPKCTLEYLLPILGALPIEKIAIFIIPIISVPIVDIVLPITTISTNASNTFSIATTALPSTDENIGIDIDRDRNIIQIENINNINNIKNLDGNIQYSDNNQTLRNEEMFNHTLLPGAVRSNNSLGFLLSTLKNMVEQRTFPEELLVAADLCILECSTLLLLRRTSTSLIQLSNTNGNTDCEISADRIVLEGNNQGKEGEGEGGKKKDKDKKNKKDKKDKNNHEENNLMDINDATLLQSYNKEEKVVMKEDENLIEIVISNLCSYIIDSTVLLISATATNSYSNIYSDADKNTNKNINIVRTGSVTYAPYLAMQRVLIQLQRASSLGINLTPNKWGLFLWGPLANALDRLTQNSLLQNVVVNSDDDDDDDEEEEEEEEEDKVEGEDREDDGNGNQAEGENSNETTAIGSTGIEEATARGEGKEVEDRERSQIEIESEEMDGRKEGEEEEGEYYPLLEEDNNNDNDDNEDYRTIEHDTFDDNYNNNDKDIEENKKIKIKNITKKQKEKKNEINTTILLSGIIRQACLIGTIIDVIKVITVAGNTIVTTIPLTIDKDIPISISTITDDKSLYKNKNKIESNTETEKSIELNIKNSNKDISIFLKEILSALSSRLTSLNLSVCATMSGKKSIQFALRSLLTAQFICDLLMLMDTSSSSSSSSSSSLSPTIPIFSSSSSSLLSSSYNPIHSIPSTSSNVSTEVINVQADNIIQKNIEILLSDWIKIICTVLQMEENNVPALLADRISRMFCIFLTSVDLILKIPSYQLDPIVADMKFSETIDGEKEKNSIIQRRMYAGLSVLTHCFQSNSLRSLNIAMSSRLCSSTFQNLDPGFFQESVISGSPPLLSRTLLKSRINEIAMSVLTVGISLHSSYLSNINKIDKSNDLKIEERVKNQNEEEGPWTSAIMIEKSNLCDRVRFVSLCALSQIGLSGVDINLYHQMVLMTWKESKSKIAKWIFLTIIGEKLRNIISISDNDNNNNNNNNDADIITNQNNNNNISINYNDKKEAKEEEKGIEKENSDIIPVDCINMLLSAFFSRKDVYRIKSSNMNSGTLNVLLSWDDVKNVLLPILPESSQIEFATAAISYLTLKNIFIGEKHNKKDSIQVIENNNDDSDNIDYNDDNEIGVFMPRKLARHISALMALAAAGMTVKNDENENLTEITSDKEESSGRAERYRNVLSIVRAIGFSDDLFWCNLSSFASTLSLSVLSSSFLSSSYSSSSSLSNLALTSGTGSGSGTGLGCGTGLGSASTLKILEKEQMESIASFLLKTEYILQSFLQLDEFWKIEKKSCENQIWLCVASNMILCEEMMNCFETLRNLCCSIKFLIRKNNINSCHSIINDINVRIVRFLHFLIV